MQWYLQFDKTMTKCHNPQGVEYPPAAHVFAQFITISLVHAHADSAPPSKWDGLPPTNSNIPDSLLPDTERERYLTMATLLPNSSKDRVVRMVHVLDNHQHNIPATVGRFILLHTHWLCNLHFIFPGPKGCLHI